MHVQAITPERFDAFLATQPRFLYMQTGQYARVLRAAGADVEILALIDSHGDVKAAGLVQMQPWKKALKRAQLVFGPVVDWSDHAVVREFFDNAIAYLKRDRRVLSLRFNPLLTRCTYEGTRRTTVNHDAIFVDTLVAQCGGRALPGDLFTDPSLQPRYAYTKVIEGMTFDEAVASCGQVVRTGFNRAGTPGVSIRFLTPDDFATFEELERETAERTGMVMNSDAAFARYKMLLGALGPDYAMLPAAVLNCDEYIAGVENEAREIRAKLDELEEKEAALESQGKALGKKQRNALKEAQTRLGILERRAAQTRAIRDTEGRDIVLAASLFFISTNEVVYLLSASAAAYQNYYGVYLIHRAMFEWACAHGISRYNFFGISGDFSDAATDAGVFHFKSQFRGDVEEYVGTYDIPVRPRLAKLLGA